MRNANEFHFRSGHDLIGLIIQMALIAVPLMGLLTALYYARGGQFKLGVRPGRALTTLRVASLVVHIFFFFPFVSSLSPPPIAGSRILTRRHVVPRPL